MPYFALPNFKHDSGPNRIQSGPDHQGYTVLFSGVQSIGVDEGIVLYASPLSGTLLTKAWDFDSNWRYIPSTLSGQSISLDPTPYDASSVLDTYRAARIYTRDNVAGAQAASAIGPETGKVNPRGGALQPRANVTRPEKYMYFGGGAPDNQDYSPYNTPDANTAAEGKTGGGVTHRNYESSLLTNLLGSQGTSDRSQWRYHQPVYCKTFTETQRSATPGLMSSPLRYIYRGSATSYAYNYGGELLANKGGFELLPYESPDPTPIGPVQGTPTMGQAVIPPEGVGAGGTITRVIGIIGDEVNAVVQEDVEWSIPILPPEELGGDWNGKFVYFIVSLPTGERQITDPITTIRFDPYLFTYVRWTGEVYGRPPGTTRQQRTTIWAVIPAGGYAGWTGFGSPVAWNIGGSQTCASFPYDDPGSVFAPTCSVYNSSGVSVQGLTGLSVGTCLFVPTSELWREALGQWEFSNNASTVLVTWDGSF